jgi:hypothetical protein
MSDYPYDDYDEHGPECDCASCRVEEDIANCCMYEDSGFWVCSAAGSEECDWSCPFSGDIGKPVEREDDEAEAGGASS